MISKKSSQKIARQCLASIGVGVLCAISIGSFFYGAEVLAADTPKFIAPHLNTPIPGLNFKDHPIVINPTEGTAKITFLSAYIGAAYRYLLGVSIVAAAVMIVWGGFKYIMGSVSDVQDGKNIIKDAIIGLVLIFGSFTILAALNPTSLTELKPLTVEYVTQTPLEVSKVYSEGVPNSAMASWEKSPPQQVPPPPAPPTPPTADGSQPEPAPAQTAVEGCGGAAYQPATALCNSQADCEQRFCNQKDYTPPAGLPDPSTLVGFIDIFPPTQKEQIMEKGIGFFPVGELCSGPKGCATTKLFNITTHGPSAKQTNLARMQGGMIFRPEVRDGLVKAGAEAKKRGYFLIVGDGTRTIPGVAQAWCARVKSSGGSQGLARPGASPHLLGVSVDIALYQLIDGGTRYRQLTVVGICGQVANQQAIGLEHMRTMEEIMTSAGFKHMCSEVHHYNFRGVYSIDCTQCEFPAKFWEKESEKASGCK